MHLSIFKKNGVKHNMRFDSIFAKDGLPFLKMDYLNFGNTFSKGIINHTP
jgi:hypothetical protein